jgi:hypothetical protein
MRHFVNCLIAASILVAGMIALGADTAEAHRWIRPRRVVVAPRYAVRYVAPRVRVNAPGVSVYVKPRYRHGGVVVGPGVYVAW